MRQNFKLFLESQQMISIFCDLDNTLVFTKPQKEFTLDVPTFTFNGKTFATILREHAHDFLKELEQLGPVSILTSGSTAFQTIVCQTHNIKCPVFGFDKFSRLPKAGFPLLIDNLPFNHSYTQEKLDALGVKIEPFGFSSIDEDCKNFLLIPAYYGQKDSILNNFIVEVRKQIDKLKS